MKRRLPIFAIAVLLCAARAAAQAPEAPNPHKAALDRLESLTTLPQT